MLFKQQEENDNLTMDFKKFEITLICRDAKGVPNGKTKSFVTTDASKLAEFYDRNGYKPKRKKNVIKNTKGKKKETLPSGETAKDILGRLYKNHKSKAELAEDQEG